MISLRMILMSSIAGAALAAPLPPGRVPPPARFDIGAHALPIDVYQHGAWQARTLDARLLDAIAPLGDGPANAATWWRDLAGDGARAKEVEALRSRANGRVVGGGERRFYDRGEPLVLEARASADQARMSFSPDIWPDPVLVGRFQPPGLTMLSFARSWLVHGLESPDPAMAREEFRRMIRLGRLLMQDDVHELQVLIGLVMIEGGLEALYETARGEGNREEQALAALALLHVERVHAWERSRSQQLELARSIDLSDPAARVRIGQDTLDLFESALRTANVRRWRLRAVLLLQAAALRGDSVSAARAAALLKEAESDADPLVSRAARRANEGEGAQQVLIEILGPWQSPPTPPAGTAGAR